MNSFAKRQIEVIKEEMPKIESRDLLNGTIGYFRGTLHILYLTHYITEEEKQQELEWLRNFVHEKFN